MLSVERVGLGVLAGVCLPAQVRGVDISDEQIHFVGGSVLHMHISSLLGNCFWLHYLHQGLGLVEQVNWLHILVLHNFVILHLARVVCLSLFEVVVLHLLARETGDLVLGQ